MDNKYWTAFGSLFFLLHQDRLLWLLNAPVIGKWFRCVLRINGERSAVGSLKIDRILPHAIFWWQGDKQVAEFRTHAKFSKRLYYAFRPLWWTLHAWDWAFADRWIPELSFGFSTLTVYPDTGNPGTNSVDANCWHAYASGSGQTWATIVAAAGTNKSDAASYDYIWISSDTGSGNWGEIDRVHVFWDTSSLTSGAVISAAIASIYGSNKADTFTTPIAPSINLYLSTVTSNNTLVSTDYAQVGSTAQCDSSISYASWNTTAYNDLTLNATGRGNISKTGTSKFATRSNYDVGSSPTWEASKTAKLTGYSADQTGTANDPKLVVTYTLISAAVTGTATASITEADIVTGAKTIIVTLTGDTFIA